MEINLKKKIDLSKQVIFDISKRKGIDDNQKAMVKLVLDYSGSMEGLYYNGDVQKVLERIVPLALQFDDNQSLELYLFENGAKKIGDVTLENLEGYIKNNVIGKYRFGGTEYAPIINMITKEYIGSVIQKAGNFISGLFGKKKEEAPKLQLPAYVIFITDGNNSDKSSAEAAIIESSKYGIFFQTVGIGSASFPFLEKLDTLKGTFIDNVNFFAIPNMVTVTDEVLYDKLLGEFPDWLKLAKQNNLIL